jgi:hypothetical protein
MSGKKTSLSLLIVACCLSATVTNCQSTGKHSTLQKKASAIATEKLGKKYTCDNNTSGTFTLCKQVREGDQVQREFRYILLRLSDHKIIREGSFRMGDAHWRDDASIEVINTSSVRDEETQRTIFSINSDQR